MQRIKKAFPTLTRDFYDILCERLKANGFDDEKLEKCITGVIDTCTYPNPTVGTFLAYGKVDCPFEFVFGKDYNKYSGCENCEDYERRTWMKCKIAHKDT